MAIVADTLPVTVPEASTSTKGIVQLNDATNNTSTTLAATANAVKKAYDIASKGINVTVSNTKPSNPNIGDIWVIDDGVHWRRLERFLNMHVSDAAACAFAVSDNIVVVGMHHGYAGMSTDCGLTYTVIERGLNVGSNQLIRGMVYDLKSNRMIAVMDGGYASQSINKGLSWTALTRGLNSGTTGTIYDIAVTESRFISVHAGGYAAYSILSGGTAWQALPRGLNSGTTTHTIRSVASNGVSVVAVMDAGYASRSNDRGSTWTALPRGLNSGANANFHNVSCLGETFIVVGDSGYASRSTNGGASWTALTRGLNSGTNTNFKKVAMHRDFAVAMGDGGYGSISLNDGATWNLVQKGMYTGSSSNNSYGLGVTEDSILCGIGDGYSSILTKAVSCYMYVDDRWRRMS